MKQKTQEKTELFSSKNLIKLKKNLPNLEIEDLLNDLIYVTLPLCPSRVIDVFIMNSASLVEKCIKAVGNKFDLVLLASYRARDIDSGSISLTKGDTSGKRSAIIALEEIAGNFITKEELVNNMMKKIAIETSNVNDIEKECNTQENTEEQMLIEENSEGFIDSSLEKDTSEFDDEKDFLENDFDDDDGQKESEENANLEKDYYSDTDNTDTK